MQPKDILPELFQNFWTMTKELPQDAPVNTQNTVLSPEWNYFLETLKKRIQKDMGVQ